MNTHQAKCEIAFDRLRADLAKRGKGNTRWKIGLRIAAIVILGFLIRWPKYAETWCRISSYPKWMGCRDTAP